VPGVAHKSEHGLVRLNIRSPEEAAEAARDLLAKARGLAGGANARLLMQPMVSSIAELLVGARVDPQFGPVIVAGTGGINVELFNDVAIRLAPVSPEAALEMLEETRAARLLGGWRGKPRGDLEAAARTISGVSHLMAALEGQVSEIEINPLAVLPEGQGCAPLDCLIVRA
jgi:succinyl-CoA synthetase beta subunit